MKTQEDASVLANRRLQGEYYQIDLGAPAIAAAVEPGQFVHLRVPMLEHRVLRRPFSVYNTDADAGVLSVIYKIVGEGTRGMAALAPGTVVNLLGPLGHGFSRPAEGTLPIIVAGGYGCAATYLLARRSPAGCVVLIGGRTAEDLLLVEEFRRLGAAVRVSTEDGSKGRRGLVTDLLVELLEHAPARPHVFACGPNAMLQAVSEIVLARGLDAEISLDHVMCCGVGACLACVVRMKADTPEGWQYVRTCTEGPVFKASQTVWGQDNRCSP
jgi:dihydroorotate dehydrogenase electron transfer subunit